MNKTISYLLLAVLCFCVHFTQAQIRTDINKIQAKKVYNNHLKVDLLSALLGHPTLCYERNFHEKYTAFVALGLISPNPIIPSGRMFDEQAPAATYPFYFVGANLKLYDFPTFLGMRSFHFNAVFRSRRLNENMVNNTILIGPSLRTDRTQKLGFEIKSLLGYNLGSKPFEVSNFTYFLMLNLIYSF